LRLFFSRGSGKAEEVPLCYTVRVWKMYLEIRKGRIYIWKKIAKPSINSTIIKYYIISLGLEKIKWGFPV